MAVNRVQRADGTVELDVSGVTAAAADVLAGKKFVGADGVLTDGTMPSVTQATPSITVSSAGLITASATQSAGKVAEGTESATKQLTTQGAKTVTPSTTEQVAVPAGVYTTGAVKVAGVSYDERAELREQMLGIQASDLYALYSTSAKVGTATLKAHVEAWLADSVYNNPTAYPNSTYEQAVNNAFEALDAYAATAGTESVVAGSMTATTSSHSFTISGLSFSKVKAVFWGANIPYSYGSYDLITIFMHDGKCVAVRYGGVDHLYTDTDSALSEYGKYTYTNGTLTITQTVSNSWVSQNFKYVIVGE